jgi:hypothetical protein
MEAIEDWRCPKCRHTFKTLRGFDRHKCKPDPQAAGRAGQLFDAGVRQAAAYQAAHKRAQPPERRGRKPKPRTTSQEGETRDTPR